MTTGIAAARNQGTTCKLHYKKIRTSINLPALSEMFARLESPSILGGNSAKKDAGRFSYWAAYPKDVFEFRSGQKEPFVKLQKTLDKYKETARATTQGCPYEGFFAADGSDILATNLVDTSKDCQRQQ